VTADSHSGDKPLCVMGMHRSGTSLAAALLQGLGIDFGPSVSMVPPDDENPRGYVEQEAIHRLNDDILVACGGYWWRPPRLSPGWERAARLDPLRPRARELAGTLFGERPWGIKDPRMSLVLPFWRSIVGEMDCVVCVRDPAEVAVSLMRRYSAGGSGEATPVDDFGGRAWGSVWLRYTRAALANSAGGRRLVLGHAALIADPGTQIERLAQFVGTRAAGADEDELRALVEPALWRSRAHDVNVPWRARRLYRRTAATPV
jgi:hypothetical protein